MKFRINRRDFIAGAAGTGISLMLPGNLPAAMDKQKPGLKPNPAWIKARPDGTMKILAVTDLHFFAQGILADPYTIKDLEKLIENFSPDMIVVTGDMWHNNPGGEGYNYCRWACREFAKLGLPWAFAWGNHDSMDNYDHGHRLIETAPHSLYRGTAYDGNYRIEIRADKNGPALWNLIMLNDSHAMKKPRLDWFEKEAEKIMAGTPDPPPAFLFFHIPIRQYDDIAKPGSAHGVKLENVCHEGETGEALDVFSKYSMVKAMFCGHDHVNDYHGEMNGIRIEYIRATGTGGYGGDRVRKGGTLITIDTTAGNYESITVLPDGTTWSTDEFITEPGDRPY